MGWKLRIVVALLIVGGGYLAYTRYLTPQQKKKALALADETVEGMRKIEKFMADEEFQKFLTASKDLVSQGADLAKLQAQQLKSQSELEARLADLEASNKENSAHQDAATIKKRSEQIRDLYAAHSSTIGAMWDQLKGVDPREAKEKYQEAKAATEKFQKLTTQGKKYLGEEQFQEIADSLGAFLKSSSGE